uniref:Wiskott-Aldrich syndrome protein family member n=1 Tax=Trichuris muris TaxID=70415 RepID=A0A5S6QD31_TRIMR
MPFTLRTVNQGAHCRSTPKTATVGTTTTAQAQTDDRSESAGWTDDGFQLPHASLLACIRQLGSLHDQSVQVIRGLYDELAEVDQRVYKLTGRLEVVRQQADKLPLPDADAKTAGDLKRFLSVKRHYCSAKADERADDGDTNRTNLFLCESRPDSLRLLYSQSSSREDYPSGFQGGKTTDSCAMQTEPDEVFADDNDEDRPFSVDFRRPRPRRRSSFSADPPLPTPEEKVQKFVAACKPTTLELDLPAAMLKRLSRKWTINSVTVQSPRKNATIADPEGTFGRRPCRRSLSPSLAAGSVGPSQEDGEGSVTDDEEAGTTEENRDEAIDLLQCAAAKEYLYDFAPFYRRRRITGIRQFLSLRRPKRDPEKSQRSPRSEYTSFNDADAPCESGTKERSHQTDKRPKASFDIASSIKCFLKKSFSFRSSSSSSMVRQTSRKAPLVPQGRPEFDVQSKSVGESRLARNHCGSVKSNLPISTSSQVMNLATLLRRHASLRRQPYRYATVQPKTSSPRSSGDSAYLSGGERRARPASIVSGDSQTSLGLGDRSHLNTYHPGYQINYPEECTNGIAKAPSPLVGPSATPNHPFAKQLNRVRHTTPSPSCSPSVRSNSSAVESNYSCDQDGYFTSMHHDCGVPMAKGRNRCRAMGQPEVLLKVDSAGSPSLARGGGVLFAKCSSKPLDQFPSACPARARSHHSQTVPRGFSQVHGTMPAFCRPVIFPRTAGLEIIMNKQGLSAAPVNHKVYKSYKRCAPTSFDGVHPSVSQYSSQTDARGEGEPKPPFESSEGSSDTSSSGSTPEPAKQNGAIVGVEQVGTTYVVPSSASTEPPVSLSTASGSSSPVIRKQRPPVPKRCPLGTANGRQERPTGYHLSGTASFSQHNFQAAFRPQPAPKLLSAGAYGPRFAVVNPHAWSSNAVLVPGAGSPVPMDDHVYPLVNSVSIENGSARFGTPSNQDCSCRSASHLLPPRNRQVVVALAPPPAYGVAHYENYSGTADQPPEGKVSQVVTTVREPSLTKSQVAPTGALEPFDQWLMAKFHVEEQETRLKEARALEQAKLDALMDLQKLNLASPNVGRHCKMEAALTDAVPMAAGVHFLD